MQLIRDANAEIREFDISEDGTKDCVINIYLSAVAFRLFSLVIVIINLVFKCVHIRVQMTHDVSALEEVK